MTREHTPRPGTTWETVTRPVEHVVQDGQPEPRPNRAARRAAAPCRVVDIDGTPIRLAGNTRDLTDQDRAALTDLVHAVEAMVAAEPPEVRAEREQRQTAGLARAVPLGSYQVFDGTRWRPALQAYSTLRARLAKAEHQLTAPAAPEPLTHESYIWEDDSEWNVSCPDCTAEGWNVGAEYAQEWAREHQRDAAPELFTAGDEFPLPPDRLTTSLPDIATYPPADDPSPTR